MPPKELHDPASLLGHHHDPTAVPLQQQTQQPQPQPQQQPQQQQQQLPRQDNLRGLKPQDDDDDEDEHKGGRERRKIDIKFIDDKSRRHITFSKRKAGIMKKAYELSILTGTQVLLLVVSETGLVYTFTTPKLQPLVTKQEGKNLIQACLNAPEDPVPAPSLPVPAPAQVPIAVPHGHAQQPQAIRGGLPHHVPQQQLQQQQQQQLQQQQQQQQLPPPHLHPQAHPHAHPQQQLQQQQQQHPVQASVVPQQHQGQQDAHLQTDEQILAQQRAVAVAVAAAQQQQRAAAVQAQALDMARDSRMQGIYPYSVQGLPDRDKEF
ncbi:SRF-type transcription factor (DNA-binding and dimerization domain)-domain-containing protein [Lipomyces japonicus]|uniref:SRF-type transcription factor (DNA-binding and dimerization domain)-domain-containing protein n=1 Tax=Lipomyces japonicus TaxID=56871 RepID=UPI0034CFDAAD